MGIAIVRYAARCGTNLPQLSAAMLWGVLRDARVSPFTQAFAYMQELIEAHNALNIDEDHTIALVDMPGGVVRKAMLAETANAGDYPQPGDALRLRICSPDGPGNRGEQNWRGVVPQSGVSAITVGATK